MEVPVTRSLIPLLALGLGACSVMYPADADYQVNLTITPEADAPEDPDYINPWIDTADEPVSTFSVDVDTASYSLHRRALAEGRLPEPESIRVEEFVNYFRYEDPRPTGEVPFAVRLEAAPSEFGPTDGDVHLLRIGVQAEEVPVEERDPVNLVFLLDVSGSMASGDKLGLVKFAMGHLVDVLSPEDTLGIVVYAGSEGVVLEPTPVQDKSAILDALDALAAGGSTNGEAGIRAAYDLAESAFREDGVNRVVLCTDGDFNVGLTGDDLVDLIVEFRDRGIFLTALGFGMGDYNDGTMEDLTNHGNGNYAYIDSPNEALRVLGENLVSTLQVVAKDVKIQVEFDPAGVERYRLIGYENRLLANEDFTDDTVDAGDIGAGHSVTALYEVDLAEGVDAADLAEVRVRYKAPDGDVSEELSWTIAGAARRPSFDAASADLRWAAAVTEYAEILRRSPHAEGDRFEDVLSIATEAAGEPDPSREELLGLVQSARDLWAR
jgi:Ca-activated chloride channel family protein